jgi:hypothetical protein
VQECSELFGDRGREARWRPKQAWVRGGQFHEQGTGGSWVASFATPQVDGLLSWAGHPHVREPLGRGGWF